MTVAPIAQRTGRDGTRVEIREYRQHPSGNYLFLVTSERPAPGGAQERETTGFTDRDAAFAAMDRLAAHPVRPPVPILMGGSTHGHLEGKPSIRLPTAEPAGPALEVEQVWDTPEPCPKCGYAMTAGACPVCD